MSEQQLKLLNKIGVPDNADWDEIEEAVGDYLVLHCLDDDYTPNDEGVICESILDYISSVN